MRRLAAVVVVLLAGCTPPEGAVHHPVAGPPTVFTAVNPYADERVLVHLGGAVSPSRDARSQQQWVELGPRGTDRCDGPPLRLVADLPDDGRAISLTLLARGRTCVVAATDLVAIESGGWELGVWVPASACGSAEWALPGVHPEAALVVTETTRFYKKHEAAALPPDEAARLSRTPDSAATLVLRDDALPYQVYELWRNASPIDGVRVRHNGALVRAFSIRPAGYVVEGTQISAILWQGEAFRTVAVPL